MNVLIINLTRFGDLIQTQPVISGFKSQGHQVGLVCLSNFASAASLLEGVDAVFSFPGSQLLAQLDAQWQLAVRDVSAFKESLMASFRPDQTVNLTPSVASRLLTVDLTPSGGQAVGFSVDEFGFNADTSSWAAYLQMAGDNREASPFNVCDIFRRTAGLIDEGNSLVLAEPSEVALSRASELLARTEKATGGLLALQMGASEERRRWPVKSFAEMAQMAWDQHGLLPVLLGTQSESWLGERFEQMISCPSINLMGATALVELGAVLKRCRALVTNDTGTMHLAAGLGVPLCGVFLATAQPFDTGPYRSGNICLEPDMECHPCRFGKSCPLDHACREAVSPADVFAALERLLDVPCETDFVGSRAWLSEVGAGGFMELASLSGHENEDRSLWIRIQRVYYQPFLDGLTPPAPTGMGQCVSDEFSASLSKTLTNAHDMLFLLSQQGMLLMRNPRPQAKSKFLASWQRLQTILSSEKSLNILGLLWMFDSQRSPDDLEALLRLIERYRELFSALRAEFDS